MANPYFINESAVIAFSGGRSSAYMLYKVMEGPHTITRKWRSATDSC